MPTPATPLKVAVSIDFMDAWMKIPKKQQSKVLEFFVKFKTNPASSGINYEKINDARDPNIRSVRIDDTYRAIVLKPDKGNLYALLWVDHHDKAYDWARRKSCAINPETGSLQILDVARESIDESSFSANQQNSLFGSISDRHLKKMGIPETLIPKVKDLNQQEELEALGNTLPQEAYEALFFLANGFSVDEVLQELDLFEQDKTVDVNDFDAAMNHPDTLRRFHVVEDEIELMEIMNAPLEKWRVFLHPSQRKLVEKDFNGPARVLGGAGTGKTVVAMHRAKWLVQNVFTDPNDRILFTTFTKNLAADIQENLSKICSREILRKIEVINLDKWVVNFLKKNGYDMRVGYGTELEDLWDSALNLASSDITLPSKFYREEWEKIVQPKEIMTLDEYVKVSRLGRGVRLSRKERKAIWPVFEEYKLLLKEHGLSEIEDAMRDARLLLDNQGDVLPYRSIIVDEAQDMSAQAFKLIKSMFEGRDQKNSLFIVGDGHQRIYRHKVVLSHCGINIKGRSKKLRINYRTTDETRKWAIRLLEGLQIDDLDGNMDTQKGYTSLIHGVEPVVSHFNTFKEEVSYILEMLKSWQEQGVDLEEICLVARTNELVKQYQGALEFNNIPTYSIKRREPEDRRKQGLRLATMHRVKGLEFERVIISSVNKGKVPLEGHESDDPVLKVEDTTRERALLYVAATRAKQRVIITGYGEQSPFLI